MLRAICKLSGILGIVPLRRLDPNRTSNRAFMKTNPSCILCTASVRGSWAASPIMLIRSPSLRWWRLRSVASEPCKHGIRVNRISPRALVMPLAVSRLLEPYPGMEEGVAEKIIEGTGELKGAKREAEDIAKAALYLVSEEGKYVSGHNLVVDGGFTTYKSFPFLSLEEVMK